MVKSLKDKGWKAIKDERPPTNEPIILGELILGDLNIFFSEVVRPYKDKKKYPNMDYLFYKKDNNLHVLRSDMYWK